jgi:hypothetical protein
MPKNNRSKKNRRPSPLTVNTSHNVGPTNRRGRGRERTRRNNGKIPGTRNRNRNRSTKKNDRQQLNNVRKATNRKTRIISKNPNSVGLRKKLLQRGQIVNVYQRVAVAEEAERLAAEEAERLAAEEAERLAAEEERLAAEEERLAAEEVEGKGEMVEIEEPINFNGPVRRSTSSSLFN